MRWIVSLSGEKTARAEGFKVIEFAVVFTMIETTVMCCFSLFIVFCDLLRQMERSIWIVKVPREEERLGGEEQQLGGAVKERTEGVERQVAALICRKRASRDKRRTTSARFGVVALACRVSPALHQV